MKKCDCKNRKRHPMLMAEVCVDCGRTHYTLKAATGHYFADVKPKPRMDRSEWHDKN